MIRGNYHDAQANKTEPVTGGVDPKGLRAAWFIGKEKAPVYEAGIANLTNDQTTMLIHDATGKSVQATLVRLPANDGGAPAGGPAPGNGHAAQQFGRPCGGLGVRPLAIRQSESESPLVVYSINYHIGS